MTVGSTMVRADTQGHVARTLVAPTLSGATLSGAAHRRRAHVPLSARLACGIVAALVGSALTVSTPARVHAQTASGAVERAALPTRNNPACQPRGQRDVRAPAVGGAAQC
ncbi:MAG: hypothetical protein AAFO79_06215, partial [Pseudomonadota bacterium]